MLRVRIGGSALTNTLAQSVSLAPLTAYTAATEFVLAAGVPTNVMNLSGMSSSRGSVCLCDRARVGIFVGWGSPGTPHLTTGNGVTIPAGAYLTFDNMGGLSLWAISGTTMTAGSGLRTAGSQIT